VAAATIIDFSCAAAGRTVHSTAKPTELIKASVVVRRESKLGPY
jgi:hypothetical protein